MFKIILMCCLVLAVAKGQLVKENTKIFDDVNASTEEKIKSEQQKYSKIMEKYTTKLNNSRNDFYKSIQEIYDNLVKMPEINTEQNVKLNEVQKDEQIIWKNVAKTKNDLVDFQENFKKVIADCRNTNNSSTLDYNKCVTDVISIGNNYFRENQKQFDNYITFIKEYVEDLRKSAVDLLGRRYETKTCTSSSVKINNKWYSIYENAC